MASCGPRHAVVIVVGVHSYRYRVHDTTGDDLGAVQHPAPNVEPGDVVMLRDGREALVTARVESKPGPLAALLEVAVADATRSLCD